MKQRALIIEDEIASARDLESHLKRYPDLELCGVASSVKSAINLVDTLRPKLVFADIELPDGNAFDVLAELKHLTFTTVFTTGHEEYAIQAIKHSAFDYLLKPISNTDFDECMKRYLSNIQPAFLEDKVELLLSNIKLLQNPLEQTIALPDGDGLTLVKVSSIIRCEAQESYTTVWLVDGSGLMISKNLNWLDGLLSKNQFIRCHRSHLVNVAHVKKYSKTNGNLLQMKDGSEVPISKRKKNDVLFKLRPGF